MSTEPRRLSDIRLKPPRIDRFVRPPSEPSLRVRTGGVCADSAASANVSAADAAPPAQDIPLPLFWYNPPWHHADVERRRLVAQLVGEFGVTVNVLHRELKGEDAEWGESDWPRMATHRCDRLGWTLEDAQSARIVELRLGMDRDQHGGYAYEPDRLTMWLDGDADHAVEQLPPMPLMFPPEWQSLGQLGAKVTQLRRLGCGAVYVSIDESNVESVLPEVSAAQADGVIIRISHCPLDAMSIYRRWAEQTATSWRPRVWLAGGSLSANDAVKCFALGASAISIDSICDRWLLGEDGPELSMAERAALNLGVTMGQTSQQRLSGDVQRKLGELCGTISAQIQSLAVNEIDELSVEHLIGVFDPREARG